MKFGISSTLLLNMLQNGVKLITARQTMPILEYFLLTIDGDKLTVTASDLETTLITTANIESDGTNGAFAVPSKLIIDTLREFSDQPITITVNDETYEIIISWQTGQISIPGLNGAGYPEISDFEQESTHSINLPASWLFGVISKTIFAAADNNLRPIMNGIYFDISPEAISFVTTDAQKMVRVIMNGQTGAEEPCSFILPKKPALLLKPVLQKESEDVTIRFDAKNIVFEMSDCKLICRAIEGKYPNYQAVIPKNNTNKLLVERAALLNCVKRVSVCSNQSNNLVKLTISADNVELAAQDIDFSVAATDNIQCSYEGEPLTIGFKATSLIEMLSNLSSKDILIELADQTRAALLVPYESDDEQEKEMIMLLVPIMV